MPWCWRGRPLTARPSKPSWPRTGALSVLWCCVAVASLVLRCLLCWQVCVRTLSKWRPVQAEANRLDSCLPLMAHGRACLALPLRRSRFSFFSAASDGRAGADAAARANSLRVQGPLLVPSLSPARLLPSLASLPPARPLFLSCLTLYLSLVLGTLMPRLGRGCHPAAFGRGSRVIRHALTWGEGGMLGWERWVGGSKDGPADFDGAGEGESVVLYFKFRQASSRDLWLAALKRARGAACFFFSKWASSVWLLAPRPAPLLVAPLHRQRAALAHGNTYSPSHPSHSRIYFPLRRPGIS